MTVWISATGMLTVELVVIGFRVPLLPSEAVHDTS